MKLAKNAYSTECDSVSYLKDHYGIKSSIAATRASFAGLTKKIINRITGSSKK